MAEIIISNIVDIIIGIAGLICIRYGVPAIQVAVAWLKEKHLYSVITEMVLAAEQMCAAELLEKGKTKKEQVCEWLKAKGLDVDEDVDRLIEAAVLQMHILQDSVK